MNRGQTRLLHVRNARDTLLEGKDVELNGDVWIPYDRARRHAEWLIDNAEIDEYREMLHTAFGYRGMRREIMRKYTHAVCRQEDPEGYERWAKERYPENHTPAS